MRSKLVKEAIMSRGLSVRQFAQSIGIPASTLQSADEITKRATEKINAYRSTNGKSGKSVENNFEK